MARGKSIWHRAAFWERAARDGCYLRPRMRRCKTKRACGEMTFVIRRQALFDTGILFQALRIPLPQQLPEYHKGWPKTTKIFAELKKYIFSIRKRILYNYLGYKNISGVLKRRTEVGRFGSEERISEAENRAFSVSLTAVPERRISVVPVDIFVESKG
jgi:hypothetical protein